MLVNSVNRDIEQQYTVNCEECCSMSTSDEVRTATAFARHHTCLRRAGHVITQQARPQYHLEGILNSLIVDNYKGISIIYDMLYHQLGHRLTTNVKITMQMQYIERTG